MFHKIMYKSLTCSKFLISLSLLFYYHLYYGLLKRQTQTEIQHAIVQNLCDGNFRLISRTNKLAAVLRKRHQILRLNEHNESGRRTHFSDVLVLLQIGDQSQTYTQYNPC